MKVLEVIISKMYLRNTDDYYDPTIYIYDNDIAMIGMNFHEFNTVMYQLEELNTFERSYTSEPLTIDVKDLDIADAMSHGVSPRQFEEPNLRYHLFVLGNPWKIHGELLGGKELKDISTEDLAFDEKNSILNVSGFGIKVARQTNRPVEHAIVKHFFDNDVKETYSYSELRQSGVHDNDVEESTYINACKALNKKVEDSTNGKIKKFIIFGSSTDGDVRINPIYLA